MNDYKLTLLNLITRITRPTHWIKLYPYDRELDHWLLKQIEEDTFEREGYLTVYMGGKEVWVSNYPYSYGYIYKYGGRHCGSYVAVKLKRYLRDKTNEIIYGG